MRYLKRYNESNEIDIIQNCEDILSDLSDNGYKAMITKIQNSFVSIISIDNILVGEWLPIEKDTIERLIEYMDSKSYSYTIITPNEYTGSSMYEYENLKDLSNLIINFKLR